MLLSCYTTGQLDFGVVKAHRGTTRERAYRDFLLCPPLRKCGNSKTGRKDTPAIGGETINNLGDNDEPTREVNGSNTSAA